MNRIVRGSPGTVTLAYEVDDAPKDMDAPPAVTVTRANGTQLATGTATRTGVGAYTYTIAAQSELSALTVEWVGLLDGWMTVSATTYAEIVGAEYFSIGELRNSDSVLLNTTKYPNAKLIQARLSVESDFEGFCNRAFVPRYYRETIIGDGKDTLWLTQPEPLRLVSLVVNGEDWSAKTYTRPDDNLHVIRLDDGCWPAAGRIVIEYEYGPEATPVRVKNAAMKLAKYRLVSDQSRIDERATTMNVPDFGNFVLSTPGFRDALTGIPDVDVVLWDYALGRS
jgi:hypothetical protein